MTPAVAANEQTYNIGNDYSLAAELADYEAEQEDETVARQALNQFMAEYWGIE